jgi:hypothetical protein
VSVPSQFVGSSDAGSRESSPPEAIRHAAVPVRRVGGEVIIGRPSDGTPAVLAPAAAFIWRQLDRWTTPDEIDAAIAESFPEVSVADRRASLGKVVADLERDDLLERQ